MKIFTNYAFKLTLLLSMLVYVGCSDDEDSPAVDEVTPTGESKTYTLGAVSDPNISGSAVFAEQSDGSTIVTIQLTGTPDGGEHPAHIHANSAAEGGDIAISLTPVDGASGQSITPITEDDNGNAITYDELLEYDGYINVHLSASELETLVAQGDIGVNELTGESKVYQLEERAVDGISGTATFEERVSGEALATLALEGTPEDGEHPAHIHMNSAAEGGDIVFTFTPVNGATGMSVTNVAALEDGTAFGYEEVLTYDGYINVHLSASELETIVAQGNIGSNEGVDETNAPTGETKEYALGSVANPDISGTATFAELSDGSTTVTLDLEGTPDGGMHPAHIHANTAAEGGDIVISLTTVDGTTGQSVTTVTQDDAGNAITYDELLEYDGYINVHLSAEDLATIVAQGDIGINELTGESKEYALGERDVDGISGTATFEERVSGEALATLALEGTPEDGEHPAHIHMNTAAEGGGIVFTFNPVNGATGMSKTNVAILDDETTSFGYEDVLAYDGYINVHLSAEELATIVAQGDIGVNELTGESKEYILEERAVDGISGTATFEQRVNGEALATLALEGTPEDGEHPAHIHMNSVAEGGDIVFTFNPVNGATGMSKTNVAILDDETTSFGYEDVLAYDGYINVHLSAEDLATIVAQGNIGSNEEDGTPEVTTNYAVTNSGTTAYVFNNDDLTNAENPALTLKRGETYTFTVDAPGHPFLIKSVQGTGTADTYDAGVTNNGVASGVVTFTVPGDAPDELYYNCEFHAAMTAVITITD